MAHVTSFKIEKVTSQPRCSARQVTIPTEELTHDDLELIEFARAIIDANTDSEFGVHTMGAAVRGVDGKM